MKTIALTLALALAAACATHAQPGASAAAPVTPAVAPDAYTAALLDAIAGQNAATPAALQANRAQLERVVAAAPAAWEARYYQARACLKLGFAGPDGDAQDRFFDQAQAALDQAQKLPGADQAELLILQAYIYQGRIMVSPLTRGVVYTGRVQEALGQAKALAPANPRVYLLLGNDQFYRPAVFGGGPDKAKPHYEKAKALFATFRPANALSPAWGEKMTDAMLAKVNGEAVAGK